MWCIGLRKVILEFYFKKLSVSDRRLFLGSYNDNEIVSEIRNLQDLFIMYPFYDKAIIDQTRNRQELSDIIVWQKYFYLSVYQECYYYEYRTFSRKGDSYNNGEAMELYRLLEIKNPSFKLLISIKKALKDKGKDDRSEVFKNLFILHSVINHDQILKFELDQLKDVQNKELASVSRGQVQDIINTVLSRIK